MDFITSLVNLSLLIAMAIPGYILRKSGKLAEKSVYPLVITLMYISQPFLTVSSFAKKTYENELLVNMAIVLILAFILLILLYIISKFVFSFTKDDLARRVCIASSFINNCGFMGIPVLMTFFPDDPVPIMYAAVFMIAFNVLAWTLGVYIITGDRRNISVSKAVFNPPTAALFVALPLFFLGIKLPTPVMSTVDFLGHMTAPLSMIILGIRLADIKLVSLFTSGKVYLTAGIKLIIAPMVSFLIFMLVKQLIPLDSKLITTLCILMAMPTAATVVMFSEMYDKEPQTAVRCMLLTSCLSVVTIPLVLFIVD